MGEGHVGTRDMKASVAVEAGDGMLSADLHCQSPSAVLWQACAV